MSTDHYNDYSTRKGLHGFSPTMESTAPSAAAAAITDATHTEINDPNESYIFQKYPDLEDWQWSKIQNLSRDGQRCFLDFWYNPPKIDGPYCNATWDEFLCWPTIPAGETIHMTCPMIYSLPTEEKLAYRVCTDDGMWGHGGWTNYTPCLQEYLRVSNQALQPRPTISDALINQARLITDISFFGSVISLVFLLFTLFIFCFFKSLQCTRVSIHKHLVVSFILRFIIVIVMFEPLVTNRDLHDTDPGDSYRSVEWLCKLLTAVFNYTVLANIFWMFVEGLYLTTRIAMALNKEPHFAIFYLIGWVAPIPFTVAWALLMHFCHDTMLPEDFESDCWQDWSKSEYTWVIAGPVIAALVVNFCFLIVIISILVGKLTARHNTDAGQIGKAVKATAVLLPLLGIIFFLFFWKPSDEVATSLAYHVTNAILQASQGVLVSVIYCFLNGEVQTACQKKWQRYKMRRLNEQQNYKRRTSHTSSFFLSQTEVFLLLAFGRKVHVARSARENSSVQMQNGIEMTESHHWQLPQSTDCNSPSDASFV